MNSLNILVEHEPTTMGMVCFVESLKGNGHNVVTTEDRVEGLKVFEKALKVKSLLTL